MRAHEGLFAADRIQNDLAINRRFSTDEQPAANRMDRWPVALLRFATA
jgi:hypothetical protein